MKLLGVLAFLSVAVFAAEDYSASVREWQKQREEKLRAPFGWLSLISIDFPKNGKHTIGAAKGSAITLPAAACQKCAELEIQGEKAFLTPDEKQKILIDEKPLSGRTQLQTDKRITLDRFQIGVLTRQGNWGFRVYDPQSPTRSQFKGCRWFPIDKKYEVEATLEAAPEGQTKIAVEDITGKTNEEDVAGILKFMLGGAPQSLHAFPDDKGLFVIFRDTTNGKTSYRGGRFIYLKENPGIGKTVRIDFNRAFNPPCAISKFTTCPIPPKQNRLAVAIPAGEKL